MLSRSEATWLVRFMRDSGFVMYSPTFTLVPEDEKEVWALEEAEQAIDAADLSEEERDQELSDAMDTFLERLVPMPRANTREEQMLVEQIRQRFPSDTHVQSVYHFFEPEIEAVKVLQERIRTSRLSLNRGPLAKLPRELKAYILVKAFYLDVCNPQSLQRLPPVILYQVAQMLGVNLGDTRGEEGYSWRQLCNEIQRRARVVVETQESPFLSLVSRVVKRRRINQ